MKTNIDGENAATPNDPKLSDRRSWRDRCAAGWAKVAGWLSSGRDSGAGSLQRMVRRRSDSELSDSDLIDWLASNDCRLQSLEADIPYPVDPVKRVFVIRFECGTIEAVDLRWALRKAMKDAKQTPQ